ncbi:polysaccharide biosynthesis tyrosine autokinase [Rhizobium rhizogenes]|uniref:polysaccharide biosynthesis tyrosine autokinase n=1 Tax=Rhizobium rhizogenes TaxID=359 RepID=UPI001A9CB102|nr:polysaccharide biosynthesis tyrosine autokinase [Rhizobium rhizogenes]
MLSSNRKPGPQFVWEDNGPLVTAIDLDSTIAIIRRQWRLVAGIALMSALLGCVYVITAVPLYTATASVLIGGSTEGLVSRLSMDQAAADDDATILSQIEILKSDTIGLAVVSKLALATNGEFKASSGGALNTLKRALNVLLDLPSLFVSSDLANNDQEVAARDALGVLQSNMAIARVGKSYVLDVSFTSPSREMSATVANAIADVYITDKLEAKYEATRRASEWLQTRIDELKQKALESDLAVQNYRAENNLLATGLGLIADQQLAQLNTALIVAQADTSKAKAKYDHIQEILKSGQSEAIVPEVLESSISNELRQKYLAASKLEADISSRLGENHIRAIRLREEMNEYRRLMYDELNRISESYKNQLDVAQTREKALLDSVETAKNQSASAGQSSVQLRELERSSETYRNLYQTFLQRYQEAIQQQSFPIAEARIITRPVKPLRPSYPRKLMVVALFGIFGTAAGSMVAGVREIRDRFFRTGEQIRDEVGLEYLGSLPLVDDKPLASATTDRANNQNLFTTSTLASYAVDHPLSVFAETLRSAKMSVDMRKTGEGGRVVGVVSTLPGEGKSTVAINLAQLTASQGARVILIDCDFRNPGSTRAVASHAEKGLLEVLISGTRLQDVTLLNEKTGLAFVPAVVRHRVPNSSELLSSHMMRNVLQLARSKFDYVILDLPPLAPVVDGRGIEPLVDDFVFVIEWGRVSRRIVSTTLSRDEEIQAKCVGAILNKVDTKKMKLYETHGSESYYMSRYISYYSDAA